MSARSLFLGALVLVGAVGQLPSARSQESPRAYVDATVSGLT